MYLGFRRQVSVFFEMRAKRKNDQQFNLINKRAVIDLTLNDIEVNRNLLACLFIKSRAPTNSELSVCLRVCAYI